MRTAPKISRHSLLPALTIIILLTAVPAAVKKIYETGDPYLFTRQFFADILNRLSGPGRLRFIFQPIIAILLGLKDGFKDARVGHPAFLWGIAFHKSIRRQYLREALISTRNLVCLAILLDVISQALIFHEIRPGAALVVGPVLIAVPYCLARAFGNPIFKAWCSHTQTRARSHHAR